MLHSPPAVSAEAFATELKGMFDHPVRGQQAGQRLLKIRQGRLTVQEFVIHFQSLAAESGWNEKLYARPPRRRRSGGGGVQGKLRATAPSSAQGGGCLLGS
ncbi:unnamed protein product [Pleuronectes platessa]|uniref:Retrotransposon gag domain-containing protein n=1 Tax=Pleuronectes platessa TaxID=8262 RepID=A0A9N7USG7_PLEPL|nr:unnamed protein product [Pleuronectes platessa]